MDDELRVLSLKYRAAYHAYQRCVIAVALAGDSPPQELLDQTAEVLEELAAARQAYGTALAQLLPPVGKTH